ncbi:MAG: NADP oxidoreductase [Chloroflexaceae bacterium]|nr:NADP oxidoreductase [Chloroflexaceae bacterium]NJL34509.1 NADP oxidoreductase [Chloroflexaceae bacterium]NJO06117.1 NADP oxidoreductase [Chloroflexaceae bacterium]
MSKARLATIWLDGCSGCHMSFLDMDEHLVTLSEQADLVYSPYVDTKEFPKNVDITLVEGAIGNTEDLEKVRKVRANTRILVSLGDCAVTGNVSSMRNTFGVERVLKHAYEETATLNAQIPKIDIPLLLERARPIHEFVTVDVFVPGCPPDAPTIAYCLDELLAGRTPDMNKYTRFGK